MLPVTWIGYVTDGKLSIDEEGLDLWKQAIEQLSGPVEIIIRPVRDLRTIKQNRYLWGIVYETIAIEKQVSKEDVHNALADIFLRETVYCHLLDCMVEQTKSTTSLSIQEFAEYIEKIQRYAATEWGIVIPDPGQKWMT